MKLRNKVLTTFVLTALALVIALFFLLQWSIEQGAAIYLQREDQEQLPRLATLLGDYYQSEKSWQRFADNPDDWRDWLQKQGFASPMRQGPSFGPPKGMPDDRPPPERDVFMNPPDQPFGGPGGPMTKPFFLLDEQHRAIVGQYNSQGLINAIEINIDGAQQTVGYIGLPPPPGEIDGFWQKPNAARQQKILGFFALGALLVSIMASIPLSARIVRRMLKLHEHVATLTQGHYENRLELKGDDEINGLAQHLNQLAQALSESQRQRRQFTADISHELRTPVASLQANIEAMQDDVLPLTKDTLAQLHEQTQRLGNLINDLYQLALADTDALRFHMSECNIRHLLDDLISVVQPQFQRNQLALTLHCEDDQDYLVWGDEVRLKQVFTNLLENSRRYTHSPGQVEVSATLQDDVIRITVSDSPPGVDKALHARLADRLFRVDSARNRKDGGAGLGLNLCAVIVKAHEGSMTFDDSAFGGLAVTVLLPRIKGE